METDKVKKSVRIRLAKEATAERREANKGRLGAVKSSLRNIPTAPRKMRLVANMIRGQLVNVALNVLKFDNHAASRDLEKLLMTAISDWQLANEEVKIEESNLYVKEIFVDGGKMLKRLQTAPQEELIELEKDQTM